MSEIIHKHKGARNEMSAIIWLLDRGYEVYRNVSPHGAIDIVAIRGDEVLKLDVKASAGGSAPKQSAEQKVLGVKFILVDPDGGNPRITEPRGEPEKRSCIHCDKPFVSSPKSRRLRIYCSSRCSYQAWKARHRGGLIAQELRGAE